MASSTAPTSGSKSAKKKKTKGELGAHQAAGSGSTASDNIVPVSAAAEGVNGVDGQDDSPYLKELSRYDF